MNEKVKLRLQMVVKSENFYVFILAYIKLIRKKEKHPATDQVHQHSIK